MTERTMKSSRGKKKKDERQRKLEINRKGKIIKRRKRRKGCRSRR